MMDDTGATRDDLKVPDGEVGDECNAATEDGRDIMVSYLWCLLVAVTFSWILKAKQKLGVTFNSDKQDVIGFKKFSKLKTCRASESNS